MLSKGFIKVNLTISIQSKEKTEKAFMLVTVVMKRICLPTNYNTLRAHFAIKTTFKQK